MKDLNYKKTIHQGQMVVLVGFIGSLLWAALAPLDAGVPAPGVISVESKRKIINHPTGGIINSMLISEGQVVSKGQDLVVLDRIQAESSQAATLKKWVLAKATIERLNAQRDMLAPQFSQQLEDSAKQSQELMDILVDQKRLGLSNIESAQTQLKTLSQAISGLQRQALSLSALEQSRQEQAKIISNQVNSYSSLNEKGYVSKNFVMDMGKQLAEANSQVQEAQANYASISARVAELLNKKQQLLNDLNANIDKQLAQAKAEEGVLSEELKAQTDALEKTIIKAPVDGTVVNLSTQAIGATIKPAESIMEIVPSSDSLIIEAQVAPQYIDKIHAGMKAKIRFDAYSRRLHNPLIEGEVQTVSADALPEGKSAQPMYIARIKTTDLKSLEKQDFRPTPGMPVSVVITTGESSMLSYIITPLINRAKNSVVD